MASTITTPNGTKVSRRPIADPREGRGGLRSRSKGLSNAVTTHARGLDEAVAASLRPFTLTTLRIVLGVLFVWFGALKLADASPVADVVSGTLPWLDPDLAVKGLGGIEVLLGLALVTGVLLRAILPVLVAHLSGTFLAFVMLPGLMVQHHNALLLTETGEFVTKNLVLIGAALVLVTHGGQRGRPTS